MYLVLFAFLTVAGTAMAWRSNPMFTLGRTVRFLVLCGLAMAIFVGVVIGVVNRSEAMSPMAAGLALGVTILAGAMFLIWMIVTASTPRVPAIARGTKLVFVHRAHAASWFKRLFGALVLYGALILVLRGDARDAVLIIGGMFAGIAIVLVFTLYLAALGMDRSLTSVERAPWLHWSYSPQAWSAWRETLVARTPSARSWVWSRDGKKLIAPFAITAVAVVVLDGAGGVPLSFCLSVVACLALFMVAIIEGSARFEVGASERLRRLLRSAPPETYVGAAGIFCDGVYLQWTTSSMFLMAATIDERAPRCIDLAFERIVVGASSMQRFRQSVLIPPNAGADLQTLQTHLTTHCPSARVALLG